jgi:hypothetical protein
MIVLFLFSFTASAQLKWKNVDSLYQPLPPSVHVYFSNDSLEGKPNIAFYVIADLKDKKLDFTTDTTDGRRLTPAKFYEKNSNPLLVVNCTFFSFQTNKSLNAVVKDGNLVAYNLKSIPQKKADSSIIQIPVFGSAIGITKKRKADVAWLETDSAKGKVFASQIPASSRYGNFFKKNPVTGQTAPAGGPIDKFSLWKMQTAVGGGPVVLQNGEIKITNNEERKFTGKAINDKHPRTAMGYTKDNKLIILVIQGRFPNIAEGATLTQEAQMFKDLGCIEALNLDGGGSSCLLINGRETIKPSDKEGERPVPAVFMIRSKR